MIRAEEIVERVEKMLPPDVYVFESGGQKSFPIYGITGGICTDTITYLVKRGSGGYPTLFDGGCFPARGTVHLERGWAVAAMRISKIVEEGTVSDAAIKELAAPYIEQLGEN